VPHLNDFASRFRKGVTSASPFSAIGLQYCRRCKQDVDVRTESRHQGTTFAFKSWCRRCGRVINRGVHDNVVLIGTGGLADRAVEWTAESEAKG